MQIFPQRRSANLLYHVRRLWNHDKKSGSYTCSCGSCIDRIELAPVRVSDKESSIIHVTNGDKGRVFPLCKYVKFPK